MLERSLQVRSPLFHVTDLLDFRNLFIQHLVVIAGGPAPQLYHEKQDRFLYFLATLVTSGVYQIGDDQARSWIVAGTPSGGSIPSVLAS
jgi:hypothetical protein